MAKYNQDYFGYLLKIIFIKIREWTHTQQEYVALVMYFGLGMTTAVVLTAVVLTAKKKCCSSNVQSYILSLYKQKK